MDIDYYKLAQQMTWQTNENRWDFIRAFLHSVTDSDAAEEIERFLIFLHESDGLPRKDKQSLIVLLHGIRTYASWHETFITHMSKHSDSKVESIRYDFFDLISFIFKKYSKKLQHVTGEIRMLQSRHPDHEIVIAAHSFGTFLTLEFLKANPDFKVKRILFCGSVVNPNYKFEEVPNYPGPKQIGNLVGTKDCLPVLASIFSFGYGPSGTFGFNRNVVVNKKLHCGHSGFFTEKMYDKFWLPFLLNGSFQNDENEASPHEPSYWMTLLRYSRPLILIGLTIGLLALIV
ncbi:alpha/beta hydrolase [Pseudidiomarina sp. 1APR75-33.1]|uniref:hypothetical protein n=1 Tax=Pseudidiomarina terrestris TaxID=2820060 RepID=UPI0026507416|nr:hypothetical protein [Pseudidiomarina sp. 1APR75-33.1]MDN7127386.1 alpha/beta hydrolase [Pseudidiomarina sp. 1APR75-33.1]